MPRHISLIAPALAVLVLSACAGQSNPEVNLAADEQAIRQLSAQWLEAATARDAAAYAAFYAPDAVSYPERHPSVIGPSAIEAYMAEQFMTYPNSSLTWTTDEVYVAAAGDMAYEVGTWQWTRDPARVPVEETGKYMAVWIKIDGSWKAVTDMVTNTEPESTS